MGVLGTLGDPNIGRHLLRDEGEVVVDEVRHHWVAYLRSMLEVLLALVMLLAVPFVPVELAGVVMIVLLGVAGHAFWLAVEHHRDRFVVTNMRVFRVHGVLATHLATMPLQRILDISVDKPLAGRIFGYGHFVFESAAQAQGLRDIRWVGRPDERDLTIQRVVQRSGVRGRARPDELSR